jgi:hypothetical protein
MNTFEQVRPSGPVLASHTVRRTPLIGFLLIATIVLVPFVQSATAGGIVNSLEGESRAALNAMFRATIAKPGSAAASVSDADMREQSAKIPGDLGRFFAEPALSRLTTSLQNAMASQVVGRSRDIDGGVRDWELTFVTAGDTTADVKFRAFVFISSAPTGPDGPPASAPEGWWDYDFQFVKTPSGWRISDWSTEPEPGYGP